MPKQKKSTAKKSSRSKKKRVTKKDATLIPVRHLITMRSRAGGLTWHVDGQSAKPYGAGKDGLPPKAFGELGICRADIEIPGMKLLDVACTAAEGPLDVAGKAGKAVKNFKFDREKDSTERWKLGKKPMSSDNTQTGRRWNADLISPFALVINPSSPLKATVNTDGGPLPFSSAKVTVEVFDME